MRIAFLCFDAGVPIFGTGGSSVHIHNVVDSLRSLGHEVRIFAVAPGDATPQELIDYEVQQLSLGGFGGELSQLIALEAGLPAHLAKEWKSLWSAERAQRVLLEELDAFRPDVMYERYSLFGYAGAEVAAVLGVPFLLEVNAPLFHEQKTYRTLVLERTAAEMERKIFQSADAILAVSPPLASYATGLGVPAERVTVLPNAVDPDLFSPKANGEEIRTRYGLERKSIVGFVGSLKPWHDLDTLKDSVRLIVESDPSVHLLVVGDGPGRSSGEEHVTFTGGIPHEEVPNHLAAMDVVVVPYPKGGETYFSPLKLFEAMALAKPVVGARIGQVAELLIHDHTGLHYEPGDAQDLAAKVSRILRLPDLGAQLGTAARAWVVAGHTWNDNARRIEQIATQPSPKAVLA